MYYTTDTLLEAIQAQSLYPTSSVTENTTDLLRFINEEFQMKIVPAIESVREDYFLAVSTSPVVANISKYPIPSRAIGNSLKHVFYLDDSGSRYQLYRKPIKNLAMYDVTNTGESREFYVLGDEIVLFPTPNGGGSIEMWYYARPNELVLTTDVATITAISSVGGTTTFTVDTDLSGALGSNGTIDILSAESPFMLWVMDVPTTGSSSTTIEVATDDLEAENGTTILPQIGDIISLAGQANIPMIPQEFHPILVQATQTRIMMAIKDQVGYQMAEAKLASQIGDMKRMIGNRVEDQVETLHDSYGIGSYQSGVGIFRGPYGGW